jgi:hypothetical protein
MTPPAASAAAKRSAARTSNGRAGATRVHRRVSGPARTGAPRAATARAVAVPTLPRIPLPGLGAFGERALRVGRSVQDSSMLGRLMRGRGWIGLLGVLLIGLVALNVSLLKLNAAAGRNAEWAKKLRVENADLRGRVSRLASGRHLQSEAARLGFVMPAAGTVHYLTANTPLDVKHAIHRDKFVPPSTTEDIVSNLPQPPAPVPVTTVAAPVPGAQGVTGATGTTGPATVTPAATAPAGTTPPGTGATAPQPAPVTTPAPTTGAGGVGAPTPPPTTGTTP